MIIIMGAVGSGKSEQSKRLMARLKCPRISTSQLLRENLTPVSAAKMKAGDLVDDEEIIGLLKPLLQKMKSESSEFILDGFPRSVPQAEWLLEQVKNDGVALTAIIKLEVSGEAVLKRLLKRGREDDKKDIILHRLDTFERTTTPVVDYLRGQGIKVHEIDGELSPDSVEGQIQKVLDSKNAS